MSLETSATQAETAALNLAVKGRGLLGRRERQLDRIIGQFVGEALSVPAGGVLPAHVRDAMKDRIDHIVDTLELYVARSGNRSHGRALRDAGVVKHIYALREVQQHLLRTAHFLSAPDRVQQRRSDERQQDRHRNPR